MRNQKDFSAQISAVRYLSTLDRHDADHYDITEFSVEEFSGTVLYVKRTRVPRHAPTLFYSEAFVVGVRGAVTPKYSHLVY